MILTTTIEGRCVPWMRAGGRGRRRFTKDEQRDYQRYVQAVGARARPRDWPLDMRYALELVVYEPDARRRDLSNELKTIEDALNGTIWADDSQIDALGVVRRIDRVRPRIEMTVVPMTLAERDTAEIDITIANSPCSSDAGLAKLKTPSRPRADGKRKAPRRVNARGRTEPETEAR